MKNLTKPKRILAIFLVLLFCTAGSGSAKDIQGFDQKRNQLIGYMLDKELPAVHFSHKEMNESLSLAVFDLYLKQLDYQKRFLLSSDVTVLRSFAPHITDDLEHGTNVLPATGYDIMKERIGQVEKMVDQIMAAGFDVKSDEVYETDPKKIAYVDDLKGLEDRWRKIMKAQVMYRYLELEEEQKKQRRNFRKMSCGSRRKKRRPRSIKSFFFVCIRRLCRIIMTAFLMRLPGPSTHIRIIFPPTKEKSLIFRCVAIWKESGLFFARRTDLSRSSASSLEALPPNRVCSRLRIFSSRWRKKVPTRLISPICVPLMLCA